MALMGADGTDGIDGTDGAPGARGPPGPSQINATLLYTVNGTANVLPYLTSTAFCDIGDFV